MPKSPEVCPFGEDLQKYWNRRFEYFSRFDEGIQTDAEGLYSVMPEEAALAQARRIESDLVLDAFTGIGGSAIGLALAGKQVISVEKDKKRRKMAMHNAGIYGVSASIHFVQGDFFEVADTTSATAVNLDPPWGGPSYKELGKFSLANFAPNGEELLALSFSRFSEVILRVPTIFDFSELERFNKDWTVHDDISAGELISKTVIFR